MQHVSNSLAAGKVVSSDQHAMLNKYCMQSTHQ
jgi:hypothetical protein